MIEKMEAPGPPLTEADVELLEREIGIRLPGVFRAFLLKYNGGRPSPSAFPIRGLANNPFGNIQVFFRIDGPIESSNLNWNCNVFAGRTPSNLLPIACDDCGDLICLSIFEPDARSVVFWDILNEPEEPSYANVYPVADSFEEFLEGICEAD